MDEKTIENFNTELATDLQIAFEMDSIIHWLNEQIEKTPITDLPALESLIALRQDEIKAPIERELREKYEKEEA